MNHWVSLQRGGLSVSKRSVVEHSQQWLLSPGLKEAPVLDLMCSHFVLTLAARQGAKFNVRRDLTSLLSLSGRHLVWPLPALQRLREFWGAAARTTNSGTVTKP
jgi:hypothetical protein